MNSVQKYRLNRSLWLNVAEISQSAKLHLFCFPYGGGGASLYRQWQKFMPSSIVVLPIQLPGRESRIRERPMDDIHEILERLEEGLAQELTIPFAFYGHSAGALLAFRLAHHLSKNSKYKDNLKHLFIGGYSAPQESSVTKLEYEAFLAKMNFYGFSTIPHPRDIDSFSSTQLEKLMMLMKINIEQINQLKKSKEVMKLQLINMLADLKFVCSYVHDNTEPVLQIPITAFHGEQDDRISLNGMKAWRKLTTNTFKLHVLPGDHFFLHSDQSQAKLINIIVDELTPT